jgi:lipopolysaccharide/colanic/teichoic acid biosynthesis glycosyltransferase
MKFYSQFGKPAFDLVLALGGLMLLFLPMLAIAAWIRLFEGTPVLFRQERVGQQGALFKIYKFRTMDNQALCVHSVTVAGDARITKTGQWLRRLKLDELPQLINVLKGEMSFVGPRPDVPGYMDRLEGNATAILELRPGITGPASLAFRNEEQLLAAAANPKEFNDDVLFPEKVRLNLQYLDELSFRKDLLYLLLTILPLRRSGHQNLSPASPTPQHDFRPQPGHTAGPFLRGES